MTLVYQLIYDGPMTKTGLKVLNRTGERSELRSGQTMSPPAEGHSELSQITRLREVDVCFHEEIGVGSG